MAPEILIDGFAINAIIAILAEIPTTRYNVKIIKLSYTL